MIGVKSMAKRYAKEYEPEHVEPVAHDTVMVMIGGKLVEVTEEDDTET